MLVPAGRVKSPRPEIALVLPAMVAATQFPAKIPSCLVGLRTGIDRDAVFGMDRVLKCFDRDFF